jgi:CheY-like chemotaxis protein
MHDTSAVPIKILLVEDNLADARLTQESLQDRKVFNELFTVRDGVDAINFLSRKGKCSSMPQPDLILLDLSLPRKDGLEVLAFIKNNPTLKGIPVVILTSSRAERDIAQSYALHCNCYINKPLDLSAFSEVVRAIGGFWCSVVELPRAGTAAQLGQV